MGIPFSLTFKQGHHFINIQDFEEKESESDTLSNVLVENVPLTVLFESADPDARFYMDGLDAIPAKELKEDSETGEVYLSPSHIPVTLYENKTDFYPFIPGIYRIEVLVNEKWTFSWITVRPKQVDKVSWEWMRDEIEATLTGLAKDFGRKSVPEGINRSFQLIHKWYTFTLSAVEDVRRHPRERMKKSYRSIPIGREGAIDLVTIRERSRHPEDLRRFTIPESTTIYDSTENRLLKGYITLMIQHMTGLINLFDRSVDDESSRNGNLESFRRAIQKGFKNERVNRFQEPLGQAIILKKAFHRLLSSSWMKEVGGQVNREPTPTLLSDSRYRLIYRFYKSFSFHEKERRQPIYFQWKRTDKLYEIWGFIKLIKILGKGGLGFQPMEGWLFDTDGEPAPDLPSGTRIKFKKDQLMIQLIYDQKIPRRSSKTEPEAAPVFITHGHNQPDTRLDYYYREQYIGSLLIDFKYRPRIYLWQDDMIEQTVKPKVMAQLIDYGNACRSHYLFGDVKGSFARDINPVLEVWAIYPDQKRTGITAYNEDYRIRLMEMTPGQTMDHIIKEIKSYIDKLVSRVLWFEKAYRE